jgi:hypothetical protein
LAFALAVAGLGCGGDDNNMCGDAGCVTATDAAAQTPDGPVYYPFSPGMNSYKITGVSNVNDGCMLGVAMLVGMSLPVNYASPTISIGESQGSPAMASLGSGSASGNNATLTRDNMAGDATGMCTWSQKDVSQFMLTGQDQFTLTVQEDESNFSQGCAGMDPGAPPSGMCTSTWTWTFVKQ